MFIDWLMKKWRLKISLLSLSSKTSEELELLETDLTPDGFLGKPFSDSECLSLVQNILKLKNISLSKWREKLLDVEKENAKKLDLQVKERTKDIHNILDNLNHSIFVLMKN